MKAAKPADGVLSVSMASRYRTELARDPPSNYKSKEPLSPEAISSRCVALAKFDAARKRVNTGKHGRQIEALVASTTAIKTTGEDTNTMLKEAMPILRKMDDLLFGKPRTRDEVTGTDKEILKEASDLRIGQRLRQERLNVIRPLAKNIQNAQEKGCTPKAIDSIKVKIGRASRKIEPKRCD